MERDGGRHRNPHNGIPGVSHDFVSEWERCKPWITAALGYQDDDEHHTPDTVMGEVLAGRAQFFPAEKSAVVTRVHDEPEGRFLRIWLAGGDKDELLSLLHAADWWAREFGCRWIEVEGRVGWVRVLSDHGYKLRKML